MAEREEFRVTWQNSTGIHQGPVYYLEGTARAFEAQRQASVGPDGSPVNFNVRVERRVVHTDEWEALPDPEPPVATDAEIAAWVRAHMKHWPHLGIGALGTIIRVSHPNEAYETIRIK